MLRTQKQTYEQSPQLFQHVEKYLAENVLLDMKSLMQF
jgi:hypothetical protein